MANFCVDISGVHCTGAANVYPPLPPLSFAAPGQEPGRAPPRAAEGLLLPLHHPQTGLPGVVNFIKNHKICLLVRYPQLENGNVHLEQKRKLQAEQSHTKNTQHKHHQPGILYETGCPVKK